MEDGVRSGRTRRYMEAIPSSFNLVDVPEAAKFEMPSRKKEEGWKGEEEGAFLVDRRCRRVSKSKLSRRRPVRIFLWVHGEMSETAGERTPASPRWSSSPRRVQLRTRGLRGKRQTLAKAVVSNLAASGNRHPALGRFL